MGRASSDAAAGSRNLGGDERVDGSPVAGRRAPSPGDPDLEGHHLTDRRRVTHRWTTSSLGATHRWAVPMSATTRPTADCGPRARPVAVRIPRGSHRDTGACVRPKPVAAGYHAGRHRARNSFRSQETFRRGAERRCPSESGESIARGTAEPGSRPRRVPHLQFPTRAGCGRRSDLAAGER